MKILVAGAGNLGIRHAQSVINGIESADIVIYDISLPAIEKACNFLTLQAEESGFGGAIKGTTNLQDMVGRDIDICIVATTANVRFSVINEIVNNLRVKNFVLEKVLFQRAHEYAATLRLFKELNISAWVNCPRRMYPVYQQIKTLLTEEPIRSIEVSGSGWGLACNSVHFIDLAAWLSNSVVNGVDITGLEPRLVESKRSGFYEVFGSLNVHFLNGPSLELSCADDALKAPIVTILTDQYKIIVNESQGELQIIQTAEKKEIASNTFKNPFQSDLTAKVVEGISKNGVCELTDFKESCEVHLPFVTALQEFFAAHSSDFPDRCPIT